MRELADIYAVSPSALRRRAAREGWTSERAAYRSKTRQLASDISAKEEAVNMAKTITASNMLDDAALALLRELTENGLESLLSTRQPCRELESLSKALLNSDELKRKLLGLLSPKIRRRSIWRKNVWRLKKRKKITNIRIWRSVLLCPMK